MQFNKIYILKSQCNKTLKKINDFGHQKSMAWNLMHYGKKNTRSTGGMRKCMEHDGCKSHIWTSIEINLVRERWNAEKRGWVWRMKNRKRILMAEMFPQFVFIGTVCGILWFTCDSFDRWSLTACCKNNGQNQVVGL